MSTTFTRDDAGYHIDDTIDPSKSRTFKSQPEWLYHSLVILLQTTERIEAGLADLQALYTRGADRHATNPPPPDLRPTLPTGSYPADIPVWPA